MHPSGLKTVPSSSVRDRSMVKCNNMMVKSVTKQHYNEALQSFGGAPGLQSFVLQMLEKDVCLVQSPGNVTSS